jgi:hypothetical protein
MWCSFCTIPAGAVSDKHALQYTVFIVNVHLKIHRKGDENVPFVHFEKVPIEL